MHYSKRLCAVLISMLVLLTSSVQISATSWVEPLWGGIAAGLTAGGVAGYSTDMEYKSDAKRRALKMCRAEGGTDCKFLGFFKDCGAIAVGGNTIGAGNGVNRSVAKQFAVTSCESSDGHRGRCVAVKAFCNYQ